VSANNSDPAPEPDTAKLPPNAAQERNNLPIDPHQPLREYSSMSTWANPAQVPPSYTSPEAYQPPAQQPFPGQAAYPPVYQPGQGQGGQPYPPVYQPGQPGQPYPPFYQPVQGQTGQPYPPFYQPGRPYPPFYQPGQPSYPSYGAGPGYSQPGYAYPPAYGYYQWQPVVSGPKRDTYLLVVSITAFICSCLVILSGLVCLAIALLTTVQQSASLPASQLFSGVVLYLALGFAGTIGGGFCLYHSMRSLFFRKPSRNVWLPGFWLFVLGYLVVLGIGGLLHINGQDVTVPLFTGLLIYLAAIFPALAILALGIRRLSSSQRENAPTTWRRFTLALVSGATISIFLALVLELLFTLLVAFSQSGTVMQFLNNPDAGNPPPAIYGALFLILSVIAPLVEETVKPLAVLLLIGRVRSKAEAFTLGLACGIGFNLVETTGYISSGYNDWLNVALIRSGAGLLHGFGAAMVALGWYCLTHKEEGTRLRRILLACGCGLYAVFQHGLWNGSWALALLPGPVGGFFQNWTGTIGPVTLAGPDLVNIAEAFGILIFFFYMAGRLRSQPPVPPAALLGNAPPVPQISGAYLAPR
jgi:RsiW-degrading membrane proteinase PrsW (M82 family)